MEAATAPWRIAATRRAVMEWRDEHQLRALALVQEAAITATAAVEQWIPGTDALGAWRNPGEVAGLHMRSLMVERVEPAAAALVQDALTALAKVDARFGALTAAMPQIPAVSASAVDLAEPPPPDAAATASATPSSGVLALAGALAERTVQLGQELTTTIALRARELIGVHDALRESGRQEVRRGWTGPATGDDEPYLDRLYEVFDTLANRARTLAKDDVA